MKSFTLQQYKDAGCHHFAEPYIEYKDVTEKMIINTNGKICDNGCVWYNTGTCDAHVRLIALQQ